MYYTFVPSKVYSGFEKLHIENLPTHPLAADHRTTVSLSLRPVKSFSANYYIFYFINIYCSQILLNISIKIFTDSQDAKVFQRC